MTPTRAPSVPPAAFGGARRREVVEIDPTDYEHRDLVNLLAAAFVLAIAFGVVWSVRALEDYERTQACFDSGRLDCVVLDVPQHYGVRAPAPR